MPWPSRRSDCLKPRPSGEEILSTLGPLRTLTTSNTQQLDGSIGITIGACIHPWTTCHPLNSKPTTTLQT